MLNTIPEIYKDSVAGTSQFYYRSKNGGFAVAEGENFSYKWPASGYLSTATDLAQFGGSLLAGNIVGTDSLSLLFLKHKTNDGKDTRCGFGFRIDRDWRSRKVVHHGGESPGARAFVLIYPEQKLTIAVVANVFRAPIFEGEAETIAGYFLRDYSWERGLISSGQYKYTASNKDKTMEGEIVIEDRKGTISNFMGGTFPIVDVVSDENKIRLIGVTKSGIINIWMTSENNEYVGHWGYDKPQNEFRMTK